MRKGLETAFRPFERAADRVLETIIDRRGFRRTWEDIDDEIKAEIRREVALVIYEEAIQGKKV